MRVRSHALAASIAAAALVGASDAHSAAITLQLAGIYASGAASGAEIAAYAPSKKRLFVINGATDAVDMIDIADPTQPKLVASLDLTPYGSTPNSVAVRKGVVAVAVAANVTTDPGRVVLFDTSGRHLADYEVGALPDMLTFNKKGTKILVANEGEPSGGVDPEGSVSILDLSSGIASAVVSTASFTSFNGDAAALRAKGVRLFPSVPASTTVAQDLEPEYITLSGDGATAWVTLQEANSLAVVDIASATVTDILPLGLKNHDLADAGLDASDRDGPSAGPAINIANWPVFGMYMPDAIGSYAYRGKTYLVTANEGDDRGENVRVKDVTLDPSVFPDAATLKADANLGRFNVSSIDGDTDGDAEYEQLFGYGSRSFTIWSSTGGKVWDSGDAFERITASQTPTIFNSEGTSSTFDTRSDNKGPEPEGVALGRIGGRTYAFIGLERVGGVMVYDVTNPTAPTFVEYQPNQPGDLAPEGVLFVSAADAPTSQPLLVLSNEASGTVTIYTVQTP